MPELINVIKKVMPQAQGLCLSILDPRHVLFRFQNREDYVKAYIKGHYPGQLPWTILKSRMRVFRWSYEFELGCEPSLSPVWVGLPHLPIHLQAPLKTIAGLLGKYLCLHQDAIKFARPSYVQMCVEMDLAKPLPNVINIINGRKLIKQRVIYGKFAPRYCTNCSMVGHLAKECRRVPKATKENT